MPVDRKPESLWVYFGAALLVLIYLALDTRALDRIFQ